MIKYYYDCLFKYQKFNWKSSIEILLIASAAKTVFENKDIIKQIIIKIVIKKDLISSIIIVRNLKFILHNKEAPSLLFVY